MKYLVEIDELAGAVNPEASRKMVGGSLGLMLGVKSSRLLPADTNDEYLDHPRWTSKNALVEEFKELVEGREREIDPAVSIDWRSLALGFALTRGLSPECAWHFATYAIHYSGFKPPHNGEVTCPTSEHCDDRTQSILLNAMSKLVRFFNTIAETVAWGRKP